MKERNSARPPIYRLLLPLLPDKRYLHLLFVIKTGLLVVGAITPLFYKLFVDNVLIGNEIRLLPLVIIGYAAMFAIETGIVLMQRVARNKCFHLFCARLRISLLKKYTSMPAKDYDAFDTGDLNTRAQSDINACQDFFAKQIVEYAYNWGVMLVYGVVLLFISWPLALFGFAMVPLSFVLTKTLKKKGGSVSEQYREEYGKYEGFVHASLQSWREIKALNMEQQEIGKFSMYWDTLSPLFVKQQIFWYLNRGVIAFKDLFVTRMNIYFLGGLLIFSGYLSVGGLLVFMVYYETLFGSVSAINDLDIDMATQKPSIDRVLEILGRDDVSGRTVNPKGFNDALVLRNVSFAYHGRLDVRSTAPGKSPACCLPISSSRPALHGIELRVKPGERIAIVGKSGSGKTTLAKLMINRYEPIEGEISLDGVPLRVIDKHALHRVIGQVSQEPYLFNLTIRENLHMANARADDARLDEVCLMAQIHDFIHSLPDGYDTVIGERGIKLSGGQKQRLAIARALLADTQFLIFDEATSALDYEAEELVQKALDIYSRGLVVPNPNTGLWNCAPMQSGLVVHLADCSPIQPGRTVVTIAHRLSSVRSCGRVIVMDEGRIVGDGAHETLMESCEVYRVLFGGQYGDGIGVN